MGLLESTLQEIETYESELDRNIDKINVITEYAESSYKINIAESKLKLKQYEESGDYTYEEMCDDIETYTKEANETMQKAAKSIVASSKKYVKNLKQSIGNMLDATDYEGLMKDCKNVLKEYPEIGNKKIEYQDYQKEEESIDSGINDINKLIAKMRASKTATPADEAKVKEIEDRVNKERDRAKAIKTSITIAAAVTLVAALIAGIKSEAGIVENDKDPDVSGFDPNNTRAFIRAFGLKNKLEKEKNAVATRTLGSLYTSLKKAIKTKGKPMYRAENLHAKLHSESAYEDYDYDDLNDYEEGADTMNVNEYTTLGEIIDMVVNEGAEDDFSDIYGRNLEEEIFGESTQDGDTEFDVDAMMESCMEESGLSDEYGSYSEDADDFDVDAMLESCKEEAGLISDSADDLLENFDEIFG